jgi:aerobic-type carbon monoxide dehydrogenase small subunit (CoxS/CutS family)
MKINLILNGEDVTLSGDSDESLFDVLKRETPLFESTVCCQKGTCGRCHVLFDGREVPSCLVPFYQVRQKEVITNEGFAHTNDYKLFRSLLDEEGLVFCTQCTNAQIFHLSAYIEQFPNPTDEELRAALSEIPCRCGSRPVLEKGFRRLIEIKEGGRAIRH